tara:strand:+ start:3641 stop:4939 length:1299 start_codon:yes stop_codon:yes gene_type:complete
MNQYDSERMYDSISLIDFKKTNDISKADCYLLNTCHIREKATEKVYDEIGRVKKVFRNLKKPMVIVTGCVAQAESDEMIKREAYIDTVIGPQSYHKINDTILSYFRKKEKIDITEFDVVNKFDYLQKIKRNTNKISNYITIQEGCDKFCNFCVVPYTRGAEYSRPFWQILNEAEDLVNSGSKEIILIGQNVNAYNFDENGKNYRLTYLIKELEKIKELKRIRFTTSHPKDMTDDLIECFGKGKKLMPFLHLPVQSGSNKILKLMNRKHDIKYYLSIISKLKKINDEIKFSSDFIVGYPGEEEIDFKDTINLIDKLKFINSYSFLFSPRPGTPSAKKLNINPKLLKNRLEILQEYLFNNQINNNKNFVGKLTKILVENKIEKQGKFFGRNEYMMPVIFDSDICKEGEIIDVEVLSYNKISLFGKHVRKQVKAA